MQSLLAQLAVEIAELIRADADPKVMTTKQAAEYLQTTQDEVRRMAISGELPCLRVGAKGGSYRFNRDAIDRVMGV